VPAIFLVGGPDQSRSTLQMMTEKLAQAVATCLKTQPRAARVAKKNGSIPLRLKAIALLYAIWIIMTSC